MWVKRSLALAAVAASLAASASAEHQKPRLRNLITVVTSPEQTGRRILSHHFSATEILDLELHVLFPRSLVGEHDVTLKVFTPNGHLYQTLAVPIVGQDPHGKDVQAEHLRRVDGFPHPMKVKKLKHVRWLGKHYSHASVLFPVAGTSIVTSSLYGRWSVEAYLDGDPEPSGRARHFRIRE
jgi:hypothetical protein